MTASVLKDVSRKLLPRNIRNWVRTPLQSVHWLYDECAFFAQYVPKIEMEKGWQVRCHPLARRLAFQPFRKDPEQQLEISRFIEHCWDGMVLFDIGAYFGVFSLAALHFGGEKSKAIAVDLSPVAERMLKIETELNRYSGRMIVERACASSYLGHIEMLPTGVIGSGYYVPPSDQHGARDIEDTTCVTIDSLVEKYGLFPTHVKIDVEGAELEVLHGGKQTFTSSRKPLLFLELHNRMIREQGGDPFIIIQLLQEYGYIPISPENRNREYNELSIDLIRVMGKTLQGIIN